MALTTKYLRSNIKMSYPQIQELLKNETGKLKNKRNIYYWVRSINILNIKKIYYKLTKLFLKMQRYLLTSGSIVYSFESFSISDSQTFIENAYRLILDRSADEGGLNVNLNRLKSGWRKVDILFLLLHSEESLYRKVKIRNLYLHFIINQIYKIPIFGRVLESSVYIFRLPSLINSLKREVEIIKKQEKTNLLISNLQIRIKYLEHLLDINSSLLSGSKQQLYLDFENRFRGSQEVISERQKFYLKYFKQYAKSENPILDVGCGRGEWVNLLTESGYKSIGIDTNSHMIQSASSISNNLLNIDVFSYLHNNVNKVFSAVTAFHVVEHFYFNDLIRFLELSYQNTMDGGLILLETPNPENFIVGSCNFYMDPTHKKPLPPPLLKFLVESVGYTNVNIIYPYKNSKIKYQNKSIESLYNNHIGISADYAIIGYK